jgi:hypothetical protein
MTLLRFLAICIAFGFNYTGTIHANPAPQDEQYFRYFSIEIEDLEDFEPSLFEEALSDRSAYSVLETCNSQNALLIAVNANYPKRVDAIAEELQQMLLEVIPSRKLKGIETITLDEKVSFCQ